MDVKHGQQTLILLQKISKNHTIFSVFVYIKMAAKFVLN